MYQVRVSTWSSVILIAVSVIFLNPPRKILGQRPFTHTDNNSSAMKLSTHTVGRRRNITQAIINPLHHCTKPFASASILFKLVYRLVTGYQAKTQTLIKL